MTLMFLVVAMKSKTFFSFLCSANEQVCRSWEGAQPGSEPKLADGNTPYPKRHGQCIKGSWLGGRSLSFLFPWVRILSCPGVQTFLGVLGIL